MITEKEIKKLERESTIFLLLDKLALNKTTTAELKILSVLNISKYLYKKDGLTQKELINEYIKEYCELGDKIPSQSNISRTLKSLIEKGFVELNNGIYKEVLLKDMK
ncbi:MarR family transcriptional regulator [Shewanella halifaxensis]|uniref:MarR family transcriptional regulator n=1 Tax=Shewanella halifaxensis TaxID=271098 RepID=UPI000D592723|nr:helix-turn-helix domain-containing protein [Shewanella halifaxensis]